MREKILSIIEKNAKLPVEDLAALLGEDPEQVGAGRGRRDLCLPHPD